MNDGGWIKLYRSILKWEWWDDRNVRELFIYCLLMANHADTQWHGETISAGTFVTSREALSRGTGLSEQQVRTALGRLRSTGEITSKTTNKFTIITICNYAIYQSDETVEQPSNQPTNNQQITNNQPANNQQITTNKNIRSKEDIIIDSSLRSESMSDLPSDDASAAEEEKIDYSKLIAFWNEKTQGRWGTLRTIENNRRKMVRARIRTHGKETFAEAIKKACESDFLSTAKWFTFDWLVCPNNFDKVISGNYDNHNDKKPQSNGNTENILGTGTVTRPANKGLATDF